ncbi:mechanosensitive ion channel family protein [Hugenholtzia roseola]|uniref:mechanosensitive ion channel family protein n=1 Tax=Hugenholtzia roseola TaxID=1002 RepID=UPI000416907D|nr:mechanosensitive ion channel family protein [Hugenholtzia roseola]
MKFEEILLLSVLYAFEITFFFLVGRLIFIQKIGIKQRFILFGSFNFLVISALLVLKEWNTALFYLPADILKIAFMGLRCLWWFSMGIILSNLLHYFLWNGIFMKNQERTIHKYVIQFFDACIYLSTILLILNQVFQQSISGLLITSGVLAIILGLSAQTTLGGVFSGLALNLNKSFSKGDYIILDKIRGKVIDMNWHSVMIEARDGRKAIIPNKIIDDSLIINSSHPTQYRRHTLSLKVEYEARPELVKKLLVEAAKHASLVYQDPAPAAFVVEFSEQGILYALEVFTQELEDVELNNELLTQIWYSFNRHQISLRPALYQQEENVNFLNNQPQKSLNFEEAAYQLLQKQELFKTLSDTEKKTLAHCAKRIIAAPPERITVQGERKYSLFIIAKGALSAWIINQYGQEVKVANLKENDIFGEMALLTGQERRATVRVEAEVILYEISKEDILPLINKRSSILQDLSHILALRQSEVEKAKREFVANGTQESEDLAALNDKFLQLMKVFFTKK